MDVCSVPEFKLVLLSGSNVSLALFALKEWNQLVLKSRARECAVNLSQNRLDERVKLQSLKVAESEDLSCSAILSAQVKGLGPHAFVVHGSAKESPVSLNLCKYAIKKFCLNTRSITFSTATLLTYNGRFNNLPRMTGDW